MNPPDHNDPLDVLLREQNTYLEDDGFTARVLAALPPRRRAWLRPALLLSTTAIGFILAILWLPWRLISPSALLSFSPQGLVAYTLLLTVGGSLVCGIIAALGWEE